MKAMRNRIVPALAAALCVAAAAPAAARGLTWQTVIGTDSSAVYSMAVGHDSPLNLWASTPRWYGTGFQLAVGGQLEEVTAAHIVSDWTPAHEGAFGPVAARWALWPQVDIGPMGQQGLTLSVRAFDAASTILYANADVAVSTAIPHQHGVVITYGAPKPAVPTALLLGNFMALRPGQRLLVLGNPGGTWTGARPNVAWFTYEGREANTPEWPDAGAHFPHRTLPVTLVLRGHGIGGMSGAPVINQQGRVVAVFVAANASYGFAVPLDTSGFPVGGTPTTPAGVGE